MSISVHLNCLETLVSSANLNTVLDVSSSTSFIYVKDNVDPSNDLWGTRLKSFLYLVNQPTGGVVAPL